MSVYMLDLHPNLQQGKVICLNFCEDTETVSGRVRSVRSSSDASPTSELAEAREAGILLYL